jgi:hypothetical protein
MLSEKGGNEGASDAEQRRQNEAGRIVRSGQQIPGNDAGNKTNDNDPKDVHRVFSSLSYQTRA